MVGPKLVDVELLARPGFGKEDYALGFVDNLEERITHKLVDIDDIEQLRVERISVLQEFA